MRYFLKYSDLTDVGQRIKLKIIYYESFTWEALENGKRKFL